MASPNGISRPTGLSDQNERGLLSQRIFDLMAPPLQVGAYSGTAGVVAGIGGAIATDTSPAFGAILSGVNWFTFGTTFWLTRSVIFQQYASRNQDPRNWEKIVISGFSGSVAGSAAGILKSPKAVIPHAIMFGLASAGGQTVVNYYQSRRSRAGDEESLFSMSKLIPMRKLSDEGYTHLMEEKILKVDAEIALIDDRIAELRTSDEASEEEKSHNIG